MKSRKLLSVLRYGFYFFGAVIALMAISYSATVWRETPGPASTSGLDQHWGLGLFTFNLEIGPTLSAIPYKGVPNDSLWLSNIRADLMVARKAPQRP